jgi:hypothetical protein
MPIIAREEWPLRLRRRASWLNEPDRIRHEIGVINNQIRELRREREILLSIFNLCSCCKSEPREIGKLCESCSANLARGRAARGNS